MSSKELVISANRHETRVALIEDDQLVEVYFQRSNEYSLAGSIHKGRVTRVLPGMQSAFVDLGLERDTFLYVSDFLEEHEDIDRITGDEGQGPRKGPGSGDERYAKTSTSNDERYAKTQGDERHAKGSGDERYARPPREDRPQRQDRDRDRGGDRDRGDRRPQMATRFLRPVAVLPQCYPGRRPYPEKSPMRS